MSSSRWRRRVAIWVVALGACGGEEPSDVWPSYSYGDGDVVRFEIGAGALETVNDEEWGGRATYLLPPLVDADAGPVEVEVRGLDLSAIDYRGGLGWPSDSLDAGALINVSLYGSSSVSYRIFSMVDGLLESRGYQSDPPASMGLRAFAFHGYEDADGPHGMHNVGLEEWGPEGDREPYHTFDLRLRLQDGVVSAWVRLHSSFAWDSGEGVAGANCPWNVAIDNAVPGTEDSVWTGECRTVQPGETGRPVGAWVPVEGGTWRLTNEPGRVQAGISISNWEHADGPYRISWTNLILRGPSAAEDRWSMGGGRAHAFGTGRSEIDPRGSQAELRFFAFQGGAGGRAGALVEYRSRGLELRGESTSFAAITDQETRISGTARVNRVSGYRYELTGFSGTRDAPDRFLLQVWHPHPAPEPLYVAFGSLTEGSISARNASEG